MKLTDIVAIIAILLLVTAVVVMSIIAIRLALPDSKIRFIRPTTAKVYDCIEIAAEKGDRRDIYECGDQSPEKDPGSSANDEDQGNERWHVC